MMKLAQGHGRDTNKLLILEADTEEECLTEARRIDGKDGLQPGALVKGGMGDLYVVVRPSGLGPNRYDIAKVNAPMGSEAEFRIDLDWPLDTFTVVRR